MATTLERTTPTPVARMVNPFAVLGAALRQLAEVLGATSDAQYTRKPVGVIPGSLGGHVRHCLDHYEAWMIGAATGRLDYDDRQRGTAIESDRSAALAAITQYERRLEEMDVAMLSRPIRVRSMIAGDGAAIEARSSVGRELAFVLSHTVHHNALIAAMCGTLGIPVPDRFGYAPATIAHLDDVECALSRSSR